jgi:hypothetical protein
MARKIYIREIYFYLVCLIAFILFIVGIVTIYDSAVDYVKPATYMTKSSILPAYKDQYNNLSQEQIDKMVNEEIQNSLNNEKLMAIKGLFRGVLLVIIGIPLFVFHWRKAQALWKLDSAD